MKLKIHKKLYNTLASYSVGIKPSGPGLIESREIEVSSSELRELISMYHANEPDVMKTLFILSETRRNDSDLFLKIVNTSIEQ